ncbi:MAG: hypothetical protein ABFS56_00005, partial [Pseudomonadota bacterium]
MCIVRTPKQNTTFVRIEKSSLEDITLSWRARGLLSYLLSRPDNWTIIINNLIKQSPDGRTTIRSSLKELEASGYLRLERVNGEKGYIKWVQVIYESPTLNPYWQNDYEGAKSPESKIKPVNAAPTWEKKPESISQPEQYKAIPPVAEPISESSSLKSELESAEVGGQQSVDAIDKPESCHPITLPEAPKQSLPSASLQISLPAKAEPVQPKKEELSPSKTVPVPAPQAPVPARSKEKPQQTLSFKLDFSEQQKGVMRAMLKGIDNAQQLILVLEKMMNQNEIKNPVAYLAGIIKKYRANQFTPLKEEKQNAAAEREAKRKAGVKDCPYCHVDDGFVGFEEPNGHKSSRLCNHDEAGILRTARDLDAKIVSAKRGDSREDVPVALIPVSQDLGFDDEIEVERQAGIKDCPFCDDNGVISYQEETGEISSDPCFHNAGDILRNARDAQAVIITAKPGYRGYKEELLPALPEQQANQDGHKLSFKPLEKREAKRKAADCPYCHIDDGFVCFEEPNGHRRSRLCDHDEAGILRTARE